MRIVSAALTAAAAAFLGLGAAQAKVDIRVDLASQRMHVASAEGDYDWPVSTGRPGFRTPTGVYGVERMYKMVHSAEYGDAPMPHAIFFSGGYAIHGTGAVGRLGAVASHGCVRLAPQNAATLYEMVRREGASIVIEGRAPGGERVAWNEPHREGERLGSQRRQLSSGLALSDAGTPRRRLPRPGDWVNLPRENW